MIYFIAQGNEFVKIGYATDPSARLSQLQTGNPNDLRLVASFCGGSTEEGHLHEFWKALHIRGEWFEFHDELRRYIHLLIDMGDYFKAAEKWQETFKEPGIYEAEVIRFPVTCA